MLLDTHLLLWVAIDSDRLTPDTRALISNENHRLWFSAASIWEIGIKAGLGRKDFVVDPHVLKRGLVENDYAELQISAAHALAAAQLPAIHRDPFDRMLVAQATYEGFVLLTADRIVTQYPGPIRPA
nr:type II toxin-antitoxin system VapC family toxin [Methylonatrum kenyense]